MRGSRIFRVNTNYNGSKWRWSVLAFDQTIASGVAESKIAVRKVVQTVQERYMIDHPDAKMKSSGACTLGNYWQSLLLESELRAAESIQLKREGSPRREPGRRPKGIVNRL